MKGKCSRGDSFCAVWFMCILFALRPCKFISTGPVQTAQPFAFFSMSPHSNKVSQTCSLTVIYDPSQKLKFRCGLGLWKRKVSARETSGINNRWLLLHWSDSDLPLRAFTQLPKLFIRKARMLKRVELKTRLKWSAVFNSIQLNFIWTAFCLIRICPTQASVRLVGLRRHHQHMPPDANL